MAQNELEVGAIIYVTPQTKVKYFSLPLFCAAHKEPCPISAADIYFRQEAGVDRPDDSCFCWDQTKLPALTSAAVEHTFLIYH